MSDEITLQTPMVGPVDTTPALIIPAFSGHAYDDATVAAFADALIHWTGVFRLRTSIIAGQIARETGYFQYGGDVAADAFNLAGLGATGGGAAGLRYPDIETGVQAVLTHHMTYIYGDVANWPEATRQYLPLDQRHDAVMSTGRGGTIRVLGDYTNGNWAYTASIPVGSLANGYANAIVEIANAVAGGIPMSAEPTQVDIGFPVEIDYAPFVGPQRALTDILWWISHDTEGGEQGSEAVLKGPTASVHFLIDRDGSTEYMVPIDTTAWTPGNDAVAIASINVEKVGFASSGYTEEQYKAEAACYRWCVAQGVTGIPAVFIGKVDADGGPLPDIPGMLGHEDVPNPNIPGRWGGAAGHTDPGPLWDWQHFISLCTGAVVNPTGRREFKETGHGIGGGIKTWWEGHADPLGDVGFPVSEELQYGGRTTQAFQRCIVQWFPEFKGTKYEFQSMLLGSDFAKRVLGLSGPGIP